MAEIDYGIPDWIGQEAADFRTPEEDWARVQAQQRPFWSVRAPMREIGERLRARYLLAAPEMGMTGSTPTFGQFLQDYPGTVAGTSTAIPPYMAWPDAATSGLEYEGTPYDPQTLRQRARMAADAAITPQGSYAAGADPESADFYRRAWYAKQFGPESKDAMSNQLRVAQLLALQRPGEAGTDPTYYRGGMAEAIRNAISNMYQQRVYQEDAPRESFLDWYLTETAPPSDTDTDTA